MALLMASCDTYEDSPLLWISSTAIYNSGRKTWISGLVNPIPWWRICNSKQTALTSKAHIPKEYMSTAVVTLATAEVDEGREQIVLFT